MGKRPKQPGSTVDGSFIFFADVCRSTALYDNLGDLQAAELMKYCLDACSNRVESNAGRLVDTRGDEVLCMFAQASDALAAAADLQAFAAEDSRCLAHQVAFRIGIHHGPVVELGPEIYGDAVNIAARLANKSKAWQTVLSADVVTRCPADFSPFLRPLGESTIRGKQGMLELFELLSPTGTGDITEVAKRVQVPRRSFQLTLEFQAKRIRLTPMTARYMLGRNPDCDLHVEHASVSRHHAEIRYRNGRFHLFDVSTNGTQILTASETLTVHRSDLQLPRRGTIRLGRTRHFPNLHIGFVTD